MIVTMAAVVLLLLMLCSVLLPCEAQQYKPTWESIDSRPLPAWSVSHLYHCRLWHLVNLVHVNNSFYRGGSIRFGGEGGDDHMMMM